MANFPKCTCTKDAKDPSYIAAFDDPQCPWHGKAKLVGGTAPEREARADERIGDERNGRNESVPPAAPQPASEGEERGG